MGSSTAYGSMVRSPISCTPNSFKPMELRGKNMNSCYKASSIRRDVPFRPKAVK